MAGAHTMFLKRKSAAGAGFSCRNSRFSGRLGRPRCVDLICSSPAGLGVASAGDPTCTIMES